MSAEFVVRVVKTLPVVAYNCVSEDNLSVAYGLMVCMQGENSQIVCSEPRLK